MRAVMDRTLKGTRDGYRWRLCRRGCAARYRGVAWRQYLERDAVRTRKVVPERYDPAPGRVAPAARSRKRRCVRYVRTGRPHDAGKRTIPHCGLKPQLKECVEHDCYIYTWNSACTMEGIDIVMVRNSLLNDTSGGLKCAGGFYL